MNRPEPRAAYSISSMEAAYSADDMDVYIAHLEQRLEAAESKLADIEKQQREPVAVVDIQSGRNDGNKFALIYTRAGHALADDVYNLYISQPAPSAEFADVIPKNYIVSKEDSKDAMRWRYTQSDGYFSTHDIDGFCVGIAKYLNVPRHASLSGVSPVSLNNCIEGRGKTLKEAIDQAILNNIEEAKKE